MDELATHPNSGIHLTKAQNMFRVFKKSCAMYETTVATVYNLKKHIHVDMFLL